MHVIGTAGHVDHGKSALVEALTGTHPDRLKEERERQMTIDLGFAWLTLPGGAEVGIIDVPGHRDFIENMLAGVGGIDAALFVVAADEGVMPQTREHLAILDLLEVPAGVIGVTKADLVDEEWLSLVRADIAQVVAGTVLAGAPVVAVSARTGRGIQELTAALENVLAGRPARADHGRPRLPIDRVFSLPGFGTVVTGTLSGGSLLLGQEVSVLPSGLSARVRGLQTHKTKIARATPGSRVAVNLTGVELTQVRRGMVVAKPGAFVPTTFLDARLRHLPGASLPLHHNAEVKLFLGAAEVVGRVRLLEHDSLPPGDAGWAQLALTEPVVAVPGDRFILRRPSPGETIAGGVIVDAQPRRRYRRRDATVIGRLETLARGTPGEVLLQALESLGPVPLAEALERAGLAGEAAPEAVSALRESGQLIELDGERLVLSEPAWDRLAGHLTDLLTGYHEAYPLRSGMAREEVKSRLGQALPAAWRARFTPRTFNAILAFAAGAGVLELSGAQVCKRGRQVALSAEQRKRVEALLADFEHDPFNTPSVKECAARLGDELLAAVIEQGRLVQVSPDVLFSAGAYAEMVGRIRQHLAAQKRVSVAEVRDMFETSRKYALAIMEHLDAEGVTRRVGDERVLA
jgi:selenocysteine-specific elongation factor